MGSMWKNLHKGPRKWEEMGRRPNGVFWGRGRVGGGCSQRLADREWEVGLGPSRFAESQTWTLGGVEQSLAAHVCLALAEPIYSIEAAAPLSRMRGKCFFCPMVVWQHHKSHSGCNAGQLLGAVIWWDIDESYYWWNNDETHHYLGLQCFVIRVVHSWQMM